jgi:hypothetical protein
MLTLVRAVKNNSQHPRLLVAQQAKRTHSVRSLLKSSSFS